MKSIAKFSFIILIVILAGCSTPFFAVPTATPTVTLTFTKTSTPTQTQTATPTKTLSATPGPVVELGEKHVIAEGGFSFRVPFGYVAQIEERQAFISAVDGTVVISFASVEGSSLAEEEMIDKYLDAVARRSEGEFEKTPSDPVTIDGLEGKAFDLTGSLRGSPLRGKTFIVPVSSGRFLYGLAISSLAADEHSWQKEGSNVFEAVIESIEWIEPQREGTCPIATDATYGYTQENAIRVGDGGDFLGGSTRERAYLDNLRGPNGELITYERTGSSTFGDTILDVYVINGPTTSVTLYIDMYAFEELKAPAGFTCVGSFNLEP